MSLLTVLLYFSKSKGRFVAPKLYSKKINRINTFSYVQTYFSSPHNCRSLVNIFRGVALASINLCIETHPVGVETSHHNVEKPIVSTLSMSLC